MTTTSSLIFVLGLTTVVISSQADTLERLSKDDTVIKAGSPVNYVGGVLEYEPYVDWQGGGENLVKENVRIIAEYVAEAKSKGVDLLVTPEYGIMSIEIHSLTPEELFSLMQFVPDPGLHIVPCTAPVDPPNVVVAQDISCSARENAMYVVVDVGEASPCSPDVRNPFNNTLDASGDCPVSGYVYYNTQVVFDRDGAVIARYRKKNLFMEPVFNPGMDPDESAIFTTDFGVSFTLQICFDIVFYHPGISNHVTYGIQDVIMSTAWVDVLPFYLAPAIQNSWSRGLGVNLLVAGYHFPEKAKLGSGIYRGASDLEFNYLADPESGTRLLVSDVESVASVNVPFRSNSKMHRTVANHNVLKGKESDALLNRKRTILHDDLSQYTNVPLTHEDRLSGDVLRAVACHNDGFCCSLTYHPTGNLNYSLVAYSGPVAQEFGYHTYAQVCSVLWCPTDDVSTCAYIEEGLPQSDKFEAFTLEGGFNTTFVYPNIFDRNLDLVDNSLYSFTGDKEWFTLSTDAPVTDMLGSTLLGRWFEQDLNGQHEEYVTYNEEKLEVPE